jgi:hypothetical protein
MQDWITKLDDFLRISAQEILTHVRKITYEDEVSVANSEFDKFKQRRLIEKSIVEMDFEKSIETFEQLEQKVSKFKPIKEKQKIC